MSMRTTIELEQRKQELLEELAKVGAEIEAKKPKPVFEAEGLVI